MLKKNEMTEKIIEEQYTRNRRILDLLACFGRIESTYEEEKKTKINNNEKNNTRIQKNWRKKKNYNKKMTRLW